MKFTKVNIRGSQMRRKRANSWFSVGETRKSTILWIGEMMQTYKLVVTVIGQWNTQKYVLVNLGWCNMRTYELVSVFLVDKIRKSYKLVIRGRWNKQIGLVVAGERKIEIHVQYRRCPPPVTLLIIEQG